MRLRTRKASWFISGLVFVAVASAGMTFVMAQPKNETSRPAIDASEAVFEPLGDHYTVNMSNVAYTSDSGAFFDIYFACSSGRNPDPLRLTDAEDVKHARSWFDEEKRPGNRFIKIQNYRINARHIAYIERRGKSTIVNLNSRILDSFVNLDLSGPDAESFRRKIREF